LVCWLVRLFVAVHARIERRFDKDVSFESLTKRKSYPATQQTSHPPAGRCRSVDRQSETTRRVVEKLLEQFTALKNPSSRLSTCSGLRSSVSASDIITTFLYKRQIQRLTDLGLRYVSKLILIKKQLSVD